MIRKLGWRVDYPDGRDWPLARGLAGASPATQLQQPNHLPWRGKQITQLGQSCVGCAIARAWQISLALQGQVDVPDPSPAWAYSIALAQESARHSKAPTEYTDRGCYPRLAMDAVRAMGMCRSVDAEWLDLVVESTNTVLAPWPKQQRAAFDQRGFEYSRIDTTEGVRVADVATALRNRLPVIFGIYVDDAFCNHVGTATIERINSSQILGGHMMSVLGVEADGRVLVDNWWGAGWGDRGLAWVSPNLFGSSMVSDIYTVKAQRFST